MKIVVLSDTHMPKKGKDFPEKLISDLKECNLIIHAGDWKTVDVYESIKKYGEVIGVIGNVDGEDLKELFPLKTTIEVNDLRIGVVHGHGKGKTTERRALEAFEGENVDIIVFGHSHIPFLRYMNGILLFNPGSPTDKRKMPYFSHGIIEINDDLEVRHVFYKK
ncbi:metallophosphoesterase family protein [Bacillus seohaeanensis]|uniref:Phosphoesterase n=1 Tax=Bacillus seohaeanensis TaxID=284580 RepID=A0ABW5RQT2_9BACI